MDKLNLKHPIVISYLENSKENLVARLLRVQAQLQVQRAEAKWLDLLATEMRDCANRDYHEDWMDEMREDTENAEKESRKERKYQNEKLADYFESECRV